MRFAESSLAHPLPAPTVRDACSVLFRQKRIAAVTFVLFALILVMSGWLTTEYRAHMEILVRRERLEPLISSDVTPTQTSPEEISEGELNSEVELLSSHEILKKVVLANGLEKPKRGIFSRKSRPTSDADIEKATEELHSRLTIEPLSKSNVISVSYETSDPERGARVLKTLAELYVEKHLEVHRPSGEFKFFDQQTDRYRIGLAQAEQQLKDFTQKQGVVSAELQRDIALQKMADIQASAEQTQAGIAETEQRITSLEQQQGTVPTRQVTQVRTLDNPQLMEQMKSTLLSLELKRTELLTKYDPAYRPVQEVEKQIADTRAAIAKEENSPMKEETSDDNPTHEWINGELTKDETELAGLKAKAAANEITLSKYQAAASQLQQASFVQADLLRDEKTEEENYLLYLRKAEQARISDALDQRGILNVAIAEQPTVPALPVRSPLPFGILGLCLAGAGTIGVAFGADRLNPTFRTPREITSYLGAPVLAAIPKELEEEG